MVAILRFASFIAMVLFSSTAAAEAESPAAPIQEYAKARNSGDRDALLRIIHPATLAHLREHDPDELDRKLSRILKKPMPDTFEFALLPIDTPGPFDRAKKQADMQFAYAVFLVVPQYFIKVQQGDFNLGEMIAQKSGRWSIVWPIRWDKTP